MNHSETRPGTLPQKGHLTSRLGLFGMSGLALILGGAVLLGCSGKPRDHAAAPAETRIVAPTVVLVTIQNLQFSPLTIEVSKGGVVEWKNKDLVPHTATSATFDSGLIASGQSWRHTFTDTGRISYFCTYHPQMKGTVIVK